MKIYESMIGYKRKTEINDSIAVISCFDVHRKKF